jgi:hypothetical protein
MSKRTDDHSTHASQHSTHAAAAHPVTAEPAGPTTITHLPRESLLVEGARHVSQRLIAQAGYTLGIAHHDGAALEALLDPGVLDATEAVKAEVATARKDKTLAAAEATHATSAKSEALRKLKVWRRKVVRRARRTERQGTKVPAGLLTAGAARGQAELIKQQTDMTTLLSANQAILGRGVEALVTEGEKLQGDLGKTGEEQEIAHLQTLPARVQEFYVQKGLLYTALKIINDAGGELHAEHADRAAAYNLKILHRVSSHRPARHGQGDTGDGSSGDGTSMGGVTGNPGDGSTPGTPEGGTVAITDSRAKA